MTKEEDGFPINDAGNDQFKTNSSKKIIWGGSLVISWRFFVWKPIFIFLCLLDVLE